MLVLFEKNIVLKMLALLWNNIVLEIFESIHEEYNDLRREKIGIKKYKMGLITWYNVCLY